MALAITSDRFAGCLLGQCVGDALGFVVEGHSAESCRDYVERVLRAGLAGTLGRVPFPFGQYTDDSQLARELFQSYRDWGRFEPADYAARIAAIFVEGRIVGRGQATTEAALRLAQGVPWDQAGTPPPYAGNGTAMRAAPVGLLFGDDPDALIRVSRDQARITHRDPRCASGAVAIAGAVALVAAGGRVEPGEFLAQLAAWTGRVEPDLAGALGQLAGWVALPPDEAVLHIAPAGLAPADAGRFGQWPGISPFVIPSVLWSLYSFLRTPDDYWETICTAIAVGGDVDTTAAMAGAISGAHLGVAAIPPDLASRLTDRGTWGYDDLVQLARDCHAIATRRDA
jgi:ADP-ribosylglycohydrolase